MDLDWCLTCGRQTTEPYCSLTCMKLDRLLLPQSLPVHLPIHRSSFDLPRSSRSSSAPQPPTPDSLDISTRWPSKDRGGILRWAHSVSPGLDIGNDIVVIPELDPDEDRRGILRWAHTVSPGLDIQRPDADYDEHINVLASFQIHRRRRFPLSAQNLAPPCVTRPDPSLPSLIFDDVSLPATDSAPATTPSSYRSSTPAIFARAFAKICTWLAPSRPVPDTDTLPAHPILPPPGISFTPRV